MDWLDGSGIVPDEGHKLVDLALSDPNLVSHNDLLDSFCAGGRGEGAMIGQMVKIVGDQCGKIELTWRIDMLFTVHSPPKKSMGIILIDKQEQEPDKKPPEPGLHPIGTGDCVRDGQAVGRIIRRD